ncbi:penicillin-binding protein 2 [bacterium]|nr:penicillin-binding protein 2 [bacterium]
MGFKLRLPDREYLLIFIVSFIGVLIIFRLFFLQIIQHDYYQNLANSEQIKKLTIPAERGLIYALDKDQPTKLVMNETVYNMFADPKIVDDNDNIVEALKSIVKEKSQVNVSELLKMKNSRYQIIAKDLTRAEADQIKQKNFKGVGFQSVSKRVYPENSTAAHLLGFVDIDGNGRYGIEGALDEKLKGKDGLLQSVTDVRDVPLTIGNKNIKIPKKNGDNIVLSIDKNIQSRVEMAIENGLKRNGAKHIDALVMDPYSGFVKAMASSPRYHPAEYNKVKDAAIFNNPIIFKEYEPGSVMKTMTLALAIDRGFITPATTFLNTDSIKVDDRTISNSVKGHTGLVSMQDAYTYSMNTGMVEIMKILGNGEINLSSRKSLYNFLKELGFGKKTGIELDGENSGIITAPDVGNGDSVRYSNMSFGQGLDVTMIQFASAYCTVINGGNYYQPSLLAGIIDNNGDFIQNKPNLKKSNIVSQKTSQTIRASQVIKNGTYDKTETIGSYIGFGGNNEPRYVIMVVEYGDNQAIGGLADAVPVFNEISNWIISYLNLKPRG